MKVVVIDAQGAGIGPIGILCNGAINGEITGEISQFIIKNNMVSFIELL